MNRTAIVAEAGLALLCAAVLTVQAVAIATTWGGTAWVFDLAAGAVAGALALARHRHRTAAALAGLVVAAVAVAVAALAGLPTEPGPALALALSVLTGSAARALPPRRAVALAAGALAVIAAAFALRPSSPVPALAGVGWLLALAVGLGLRLRDERRRALADRIRQDQRLDLARDLHDVVAHHITGVVLATQAARLTARKRPADLDDTLASVEAAGTDALAAMRRLVGLLRDTADTPRAADTESIRALVERFGARGPAVRLTLPEDGEEAWPAEIAGTVYRVVQEALTNVSRHAPRAGGVAVTVTGDGHGVTVEVTDDGTAARRRRTGGYGLIGMRERVEALGGTLDAGPAGPAGWSVRATLPLPARAAP